MWRGSEGRLDVVTVPEAEGRLVEARIARDAGNGYFREKQVLNERNLALLAL